MKKRKLKKLIRKLLREELRGIMRRYKRRIRIDISKLPDDVYDEILLKGLGVLQSRVKGRRK